MISFLGNTWQQRGDFDPKISFFDNFLRIRGLEKNDISEVNFDDLADPFDFHQMEKAILRVEKAKKEKERVMIFGDYDLDGMSGSSQLFFTFKALGIEVSYRLPSRDDGYGLSKKFIDEAKEKNVSLFITTDCGISSLEAIIHAKNLGIDVIITDHHSIPNEIPPAYAILHPLIKEETFSDKGLTGAGVAWFFCSGLLRHFWGAQKSKNFEEELLEIAMLGTIADCGKLWGENRKITILGLKKLKTTRHEGLKKLLELSRTHPDYITAESVAFFLAPRLNAAGRIAHPHISLELLLGNKHRAEELEYLNRKRQELVETYLKEAEEIIADQKDIPAFVLRSKHWEPGVIGLISGKIAEKYSRPTVVMTEKGTCFIASCRGPKDFHFAKTFQKIKTQNSKIFLSFGGHAQAAGFSLQKDNFDTFCQLFLKEVIDVRGIEIPPPVQEFDFKITRNLSFEEIALLKTAEPFGEGNPSPVFLFSALELMRIRTIGEKNHLGFTFASNLHSLPFSGIFFHGEVLFSYLQEREFYDVLATPELRKWNGKNEISLKIIDMKSVE